MAFEFREYLAPNDGNPLHVHLWKPASTEIIINVPVFATLPTWFKFVLMFVRISWFTNGVRMSWG